MAWPPQLPSWLRKSWETWHQIDALRGLVETARSWGWLVLVAVTYGAAVVSIVISVVLVAVGWLANWGVYIVAPVAILVATLPNLLVLRAHLRNTGPITEIKRPRGHKPIPAAPGEEIILLEPVDSALVGSTFSMRGYAKTFEANVVVEYLKQDGVWEVAAITTAKGMEEDHTAFSVDVTLPFGRYRMRVGDYSPSDSGWYGAEIDVIVADLDDRIEPGFPDIAIGAADLAIEHKVKETYVILREIRITNRSMRGVSLNFNVQLVLRDGSSRYSNNKSAVAPRPMLRNPTDVDPAKSTVGNLAFAFPGRLEIAETFITVLDHVTESSAKFPATLGYPPIRC